MKKTILLSIMALSITISSTFAQMAPKKEFTVSMSQNDITLTQGESKTIDVAINRSKAYKVTDIDLSIGSTMPEGLSVTFENGNDPLNQRKMILTATENLELSSKSLVLKAKSSRVSKGVIFKLHTEATVITAN
jgi:hypothetical protein